MKTRTENDYLKSNVGMFEFALRKWKFLIGVALVATILGVVFSGPKFITPEFTSYAVIYPANLGEYSGETRLEQMQQYLQSNEIRNAIIEKYNLYEEYKIDPNYPGAKTFVDNEYAEHVVYTETRFESINISVSSISPEKAKEMVDEIILLLNQTINSTQKEKYKEIVVIDKRLLEQKKAQLDSLKKSVNEYSIKYGLLDYVFQSKEVSKGYVDFLLSGKKGADFNTLNKLYENLQAYGSEFHNMRRQLELVNLEYIKRLNTFEESLKDYHKLQTFSHVIVKAQVSDKKSSPIRWLIVFSSAVSALFFTFVLLLIFGYKNK